MNIWDVPMGEQDVPKCGNMIRWFSMIIIMLGQDIPKHEKTTRWSMFTFMQTSCAIGKRHDPIREHDTLNMGTSVYNVGMLFLKFSRCHVGATSDAT